jgi:thiol-disulfide isomerase/thioredoxin
MDKIIKIVIAILAIVVVASMALLFTGTMATLAAGSRDSGTIYFFYGEECPHCHTIMPFVENMTRKYPEANIQILEVWHNQTNQKIYQDANTAAGVKRFGVPEVVSGKTVLVGELEIPAKFEGLIQDYLKKKA